MMDIRYPDWMNESQKKCYRMLCDIVGGQHHIRRAVKDCGPRGIETTVANDWATYDFNELTRLVVLAHDRGIRASLAPRNFQLMELQLYVRDYREGGFSWNRHLTLERHVEAIRARISTDDNMPNDLSAKGE